MFKFLHAADIHLDSPLRGLERYEGAPREEIRGATRKAFENLIDEALSEDVAFLLLAGDLYDGDWKDYNTGLFFTKQMARLAKSEIPVFCVTGNHDAASSITRNLRPPDNVTFFPLRESGTEKIPELKVAIHGQGFADRAVTTDLSSGYPDSIKDHFNIGLLHTCAEGHAGHEPYAPCQIHGLASKGYDYWALGHVHKRQILSEDPWVVFPGNLQGRHIRETGPKGATLVTVEDHEVTEVQHRTLDVLRWSVCEVDISPTRVAAEVVDTAVREIETKRAEAPDRVLATRVHLYGTSDAHGELTREEQRWTNEIRSAVLERLDDVWVEKVSYETETPVDLESLEQRDDPIGGLLRSIHEIASDQKALKDFSESFDDLKKKLPPEYQQLEGAIDPSDPAVLSKLLWQVRQNLIPQLLGGNKAS